jgi:hypothetical protein
MSCYSYVLSLIASRSQILSGDPNIPAPGYAKIAPSAMVDESTCTWNVFSQYGKTNIGTVTIFSFRVSRSC